MQRVSTLPARRRWPLDEEGSRLRVSAVGCVGNGRNEQGGQGPRRGSRAGARFALTLISLALDQGDVMQVPDWPRRSERQLSQTSPDERIVAMEEQV